MNPLRIHSLYVAAIVALAVAVGSPIAQPKDQDPIIASAPVQPASVGGTTPTPSAASARHRRSNGRVKRPASGDRPGFAVRRGSRLYLNGSPYRFTGITAYELATLWSINKGCGAQVDNLDALFAGLRPNSMVKVSAFQALAVNKHTGRIDFRAIDRVVAAATRHRQKLVMSLSVQQGDCDDGHWKDAAWYAGGYRRGFDDDGDGLAHRSFWTWMHLIVPRYRNSPAIGMWQLVGEPEASNCAGRGGRSCYGHGTCPSGATATLRRFFDTVGGELKRLDPNHLLGTGTLSRLQCGWSGGGYRGILGSHSVDVANFHDYGNESSALPSDLRGAIADARAAGKPFVMDEAGMAARAGGGDCMSTDRRSGLMRAKLRAGFRAGMSGFLAWNWEPRTDGSCNMVLRPGDPLLAVLKAIRI